MQIGCHVQKGKGYAQSIEDAIRVAAEYGIKLGAAQIFVMGPKSHTLSVQPTDWNRLRRIATEIKLYIHSAYVNNLWGENDSAQHVNAELEIADAIGASGLVVHLGAAAQNHESLISKLSNISAGQTPIYLEINAVKPSDLSFESTERINRLFSRLADLKNRQFGLCVDTAHLASCGVLLSSWAAAEQWLDGLSIGGAPVMFHLNDSAAEPGMGVDRHQTLAKGVIWGEDDSGLHCILAYASKHGATLILERNYEDLTKDYALLSKA